MKKERERRAHVVSYHLLRAKQRLLESDREFADRKIHEMVAESDDVRATVVDVAHQHRVDAIVVGSRGHGTIKRALLGSLSSYLVHHFDGALSPRTRLGVRTPRTCTHRDARHRQCDCVSRHQARPARGGAGREKVNWPAPEATLLCICSLCCA